MTPTPTPSPNPAPIPYSTRPTFLLLRIAVAAAAMMAVALAVAGCAFHGNEHEHDHAELSPGAFVEDSIFHLESEWTGPDGAKRSLARALGGKPAVAAMIYTSCEHACPVIVSDMMKIRQKLESSHADARFVLFSFDPERDTPDQMRDYRGRQRLSQWTILAPADSDSGAERELAAALGVRFKPIPGGDFAHSNIIFILDANGVPRHRQVGLMRAPDESAAILRGLLKK